MARLRKRRVAIVGSAALLVGWIALNAIVSGLPTGARLDLTEGSLYTLSPGVRSMLEALNEPVRVELFSTEEGTREIPQIRNHALRVEEFLRELARASNGRVEVSVIDPRPYSEAEDAAKAAGIVPITVDSSGRQAMLGLLVTGPTDRREGIPYLNPADEAYLEYDISRAIISVSRATRAKVAMVTSLPMDASFDPRSQRMTEPWQVLAQLRTLFDVEVVAPSAEKLPEAFDALVIAHPKGVSETLQRSIDSYAVGGGRILLFMDPYCESDASAAGPGGFGAGGGASDLGTLPESWGIRWVPGRVVADRLYAQRVRARSEAGLATVEYPAWLLLPKATFAQGDPAFGTLQTLVMLSAGSLSTTDGSALAMTPLIDSSADSMIVDGSKLGPFADPAGMLRDFKADGERHALAARYTGQVKSAFAAPSVDASATIVVVADADLLRNETWIQEERLGALSLGWRTFADNGALMLNTVEQLCGNSALLSLRGRGESQRPFTAVAAIQRQAEDRYRARAEELEARVTQIQTRINEIQRQKAPDQMLILTPEQQAQLETAKKEIVEARKELRQVQFSLREDVEALGHRLMLLNVVAWPLVVAAVVVLFGMRRQLFGAKGTA
ncbi:MAG: hypothetical protein EXS03_02175 [Phycisphaerales bacterium]|nr:hypothetical protein [Phycisphaerales bacterium]